MESFAIGRIQVHRIEEWAGPFAPPSELFAGYEEASWERQRPEFTPDYFDAPSGKVFGCLQSWLIDTGTVRILFDTGAGNDKDRPNLPIFGNLQTDFLGRLARAGYQPEDIDIVVCSHIHVDHVGWNTRLVDGRWEPTFRNARYVLPIRDRDYWDPLIDGAGPQGIGALVNANMFEDSVRPILDAGRAEWADDGFEVLPGMILRCRPGHTPGSMSLHLASDGEKAMFVGDIVHHPAQIYRPDWNSIFCEDQDQARETRRTLLEEAAREEALLVPAHFAGSHAARVVRDGKGFRPVLTGLL